MKFRTLIVLLAALTLLLLASTASAHGNSADKLANAGWNCFHAGPANWIHCTPPGAPLEKGKATTVMVFGVEGHPFLGTELLIHKSVYNGQLCMTDHGGPYDEPLPGVMACHHFETGHH